MTIEELNAIVDGISKPFIEKLDAANARVLELEQRIAALPKPERGERGEKGDTPDLVEWLRENQQGITDYLLSRIPPAVNGRDGADGKDGRDGIDGKDGKDGLPGRDGQDGKDGQIGPQGPVGAQGERGERGESVQGPEGLRGEVGPIGPAGPAGEQGLDGLHGDRGEPGVAGKDGQDGRSITPEEHKAICKELIAEERARWELDWQRHANETLQRAIDRMPAPKDGRDGFGFDDLDVAHDGDGNVTLIFKRGDTEKRFELRFPRQKYRGVYRAEESYREGDSVTFGGSQWTALQDNPPERPSVENSGWQLSVKKGTDGRNGVMKEPPPSGPVKL